MPQLSVLYNWENSFETLPYGPDCSFLFGWASCEPFYRHLPILFTLPSQFEIGKHPVQLDNCPISKKKKSINFHFLLTNFFFLTWFNDGGLDKIEKLLSQELGKSGNLGVVNDTGHFNNLNGPSNLMPA